MKSWSSLLSPASETNAACLRASAANVAVRTSGTQTCSGRRPRSRILRRYSPTLSLTVTLEMLHVTGAFYQICLAFVATARWRRRQPAHPRLCGFQGLINDI